MNPVAGLQRLYSRGHEFLTVPVQGICYMGISEWAQRHLVKFTFARLDYNPKLMFAYHNREQISDFLRRVEQEEKLTAHQKLFRGKFCIR